MYSQALFGVYDGHGKDGHHVARFVRDNLHKHLATSLATPELQHPSSSSASAKAVDLDEDTMTELLEEAITSAHTRTNMSSHDSQSFNDDLAGTTSITVLFRNSTLYVANVGDSRAVIVSVANDGMLLV
jgi:serine/threonine protein phosphatase PrpC